MTAKRRKRVAGDANHNIYTRPDGTLELVYRDSTGTQRHKTVAGGIMAARAERDRILGAKANGALVRPNPKLRFADAAEQWLARDVADLREGTRRKYADDARLHLLPRWGRRRLDAITTADCARLVRELRAAGYSEHVTAKALWTASAVFRFARRELRWYGSDPTADLGRSQRPKIGEAQRKRIFTDSELVQTLAALSESWAPAFLLAATTGLRKSELLGLRWADLRLDDPAGAWLEVTAQLSVARGGRPAKRVDLKTPESEREVGVPPEVATVLREHRLRQHRCGEGDFVFATVNGTARSQRNFSRAVADAMRDAIDEHGEPTFPALHRRDDRGRRVKPDRDETPTIHGLRHTFVSKAIADGEDVNEIAWTTGHKDSRTLVAVYAHEIRSAQQRNRRLARAQARYGSILAVADGSEATPNTPAPGAEVVDLQRAGGARQ